MDGQQHADHINQDMSRMEQPRLSCDGERHSDVHRISHETMKTPDDEDLSWRDRSWCSTAKNGEAPERGVTIDDDPEHDQNDCFRRFSTRPELRDRRRVLSQTPRYVASDRAGHEDREYKSLDDRCKVGSHSRIFALYRIWRQSYRRSNGSWMVPEIARK